MRTTNRESKQERSRLQLRGIEGARAFEIGTEHGRDTSGERLVGDESAGLELQSERTTRAFWYPPIQASLPSATTAKSPRF